MMGSSVNTYETPWYFIPGVPITSVESDTMVFKCAHISDAVVVGGSAGSLNVLIRMLEGFPRGRYMPIIVVTHMHPVDDGTLAMFLRQKLGLDVKEAEEKEVIKDSRVYLAPSNYHLLIEPDWSFSLSVDNRVNYARPSIDVLFESAAMAYGHKLTAIILTGSNHDGANGIRMVRKHGGITIAQSPSSAEYAVMPKSAIETGAVDRVYSISQIRKYLIHTRGLYDRTKNIDSG